MGTERHLVLPALCHPLLGHSPLQIPVCLILQQRAELLVSVPSQESHQLPERLSLQPPGGSIPKPSSSGETGLGTCLRHSHVHWETCLRSLVTVQTSLLAIEVGKEILVLEETELEMQKDLGLEQFEAPLKVGQEGGSCTRHDRSLYGHFPNWVPWKKACEVQGAEEVLLLCSGRPRLLAAPRGSDKPCSKGARGLWFVFA